MFEVIFPVLEQLEIRSLPSITKIWDKQVLPTMSYPHLESEDANNCYIIFSQLRKVELRDLDNLNAFCGSSTGLFDPQVIFTALEELKIESLPNITEIWDKQVLPTKSFLHLAYVEVSSCEKLVTVFPSNLWSQSYVTKVIVRNCKGVTVVVSITGLEECEDANNCSIIFPQLREVYLFNLENLHAFCSNTTGSKPQSFFNHQVIFPALEQLEIRSLPNITEIWDKKAIFPALEELEIRSLPSITEIWDKQVLPTKSFPHLATLLVKDCERLVTVFPSNLWAQSYVSSVIVEACNGVTVIFSITGREESEDINNCSIIFPNLRKVELYDLKNLNVFCRNSTCFFDPEVIFPALEHLRIWSLPNITEIWDKQVFPTKSFPHLANVDIYNCEKLVTVFPSNLWAQSYVSLVSVETCKRVTVIVSITGLEESEDANNCSIIFPKLRNVTLMNLENLNAFCGSNSTASKLQSLFDHRVIFPALEDLEIVSLPSITEIWDKQVLPTKSFPYLADVQVKNCMKLVNVFPSNLWAQSYVRKVIVEDCKGVTVVASITGLEENDDANNCSVIFPQLREVCLTNLENLNAFCGNSTGSKPQSLFDPGVHFPALKEITLKDLPNMEIFKQLLSKGEVKFPAIRDLEIGCEFWFHNGKPNMSYLAPQVFE